MINCSIIILLALVATSIIGYVNGRQNDRYLKCQLICKNYMDSKEYKSNVCQGSRNIMPKPAVYNACSRGQMLGIEHACMSTCIQDTNDERSKGNSSQACKPMEKRALPNFELPWCRRGYDQTYTQVKDIISDIIDSSFASMEDEEEVDSSTITSSNQPDEINVASISENGEVNHIQQINIKLDVDMDSTHKHEIKASEVYQSIVTPNEDDHDKLQDEDDDSSQPISEIDSKNNELVLENTKDETDDGNSDPLDTELNKEIMAESYSDDDLNTLTITTSIYHDKHENHGTKDDNLGTKDSYSDFVGSIDDGTYGSDNTPDDASQGQQEVVLSLSEESLQQQLPHDEDYGAEEQGFETN